MNPEQLAALKALMEQNRDQPEVQPATEDDVNQLTSQAAAYNQLSGGSAFQNEKQLSPSESLTQLAAPAGREGLFGKGKDADREQLDEEASNKFELLRQLLGRK